MAFNNPGAGFWISQAKSNLIALGDYTILEQHLSAMTARAVAGKTAQLQLHAQKRTWMSTDTKIIDMYTRINASVGATLGAFNKLNSMDTASITENDINTIGQHLEDLNHNMLLLHDIYTIEIRHLQLVLISFHQQTAEVREGLLRRYITLLDQRVEQVYTATLRSVLEDLLPRVKTLTDALGPRRSTRPQNATARLDVATSDTADFTQRLGVDLTHIRGLPRQEARLADPDVFWTATAAGRTSRDERTGALAMREMRKLRDGPVRKLVLRWLRILSPGADPELANMIRTIRTAVEGARDT